MFEIGFSELLLISVIALVVLGPERLPKLAAQVGRWVGRARSMARTFREQLESEVNLEELAKTPPPKPAEPWPPAASENPAAAENADVAPPDLSAADSLADTNLAAAEPPADAAYEPGLAPESEPSPAAPEPAAATEFQHHPAGHHPEAEQFGAWSPPEAEPARRPEPAEVASTGTSSTHGQ